MFLEIVTPDKKIFSGEIKQIKVPGSNGPFEVLNNHAAIISTLSKGEVKVISPEGEKTFYNIASGVIEVNNNKIVVLAEF
jgi:F-type H+-transporting ATPase subunit epsilon